jgi:choline dehydrogenase-like flavoprotein
MTMPEINFEPDYIIVGAGAAGCVLAARLAEEKNNKVLLIEAGPDNTNEQHIVTAATWLYLADLPKAISPDGSPSHLGYETTPQKGKVYGYPRGTGLGGSSNHHAMVDGRGSPVIYDGWAEKLGDKRWSGESLNYYFKKMEKYNVPNAKKEAHGQDGWLNIKIGKFTEEFQLELIDAIKTSTDATFRDDWYDDPKNHSGVGCFPSQVHLDGRRSYPAKDLLLPRLEENTKNGWNNLQILTDSTCAKVIFEGAKAVGVETISGPNALKVDKRHKPASINGPRTVIKAKKEVILCCGSINTPQLLMLSGVGPKAELDKHNIKMVKELAGVGQGINDHMEVAVTFEFPKLPNKVWKAQAALLSLSDPAWAKHADMEFLTENGITLGWEWFSDLDERDYANPDLHIHCFPLYFRDFNFNPEIFNDKDPLKAGYVNKILSVLDPVNPKAFYTFLIEIMKTEANTGTITLASTEPTDPPIIDLQLNQNDKDVTRLAHGIELVRRLMKAESFSHYEMLEEHPGPAFEGLEGAKDYVNRYSAFGHHMSGTCKMGKVTDPMAVVDTDLKVIGTEGLRICDTSVFPTIPGYNTSRPAYMVGEVLADRIMKTKSVV